jgi:hypothetical protein
VTGLTLDRARRRVVALLFGISDMTSVEAAAEHLLEADPTASGRAALVQRTLEAGLVIVYARPFTESRGLPRLRAAAFQTEHLSRVHDAYLEQRNKVYAHTDETDYRVILDLDDDEWLGQFLEHGPRFGETWAPPTPDLLEDVRALAVANRESFVEELNRLRERLRAT